MVNQQKVFDEEAEKQLSDKVCLHDQMEKRLQRLKKKLNPEQMKKHEEAFKKKYGCGDDDGHDHHGTGPEHANDGHWHHGDNSNNGDGAGAAGHGHDHGEGGQHHHHHGGGGGHHHHSSAGGHAEEEAKEQPKPLNKDMTFKEFEVQRQESIP